MEKKKIFLANENNKEDNKDEEENPLDKFKRIYKK